MTQHIKFPSIEQFRTTVKWATQYAKHNNLPPQVVSFEGTVKLHGTNGGLLRTIGGTEMDIAVASRERIITPDDDNAGFAAWVNMNRSLINSIFDRIAAATKDHFPSDTPIQIVGEWCGGNIQKGVGLNQLPKMFVVFAIRMAEVGASDNPDEPIQYKNIWFTRRFVETFVQPSPSVGLRHIYEFPTWVVDVDFDKPHEAQNAFVKLVEEVEARCPVAALMLGDQAVDPLIGEGLVWTPVGPPNATFVNVGQLRFKTKGDKHSATKVKTVAAVDVEKFETIEKFVDAVCTESRLTQGIDKLREMGLSVDSKHTGDYIKWIVGDVLKEESDTLEASGLTTKDITSRIATKARTFFNQQLGV